jgi:hypothetical protein
LYYYLVEDSNSFNLVQLNNKAGNMKVAIIGAGPSGLTTLKYLATAHEYFSGLEPITVRLFEDEQEIGGTFRYRTYRDSEVNGTSNGQNMHPVVDIDMLLSAACLLQISNRVFGSSLPT